MKNEILLVFTAAQQWGTTSVMDIRFGAGESLWCCTLNLSTRAEVVI